MDKINQTIAGIKPLDEKAMAEARMRQDSLTKPQGSLGQLEIPFHPGGRDKGKSKAPNHP